MKVPLRGPLQQRRSLLPRQRRSPIGPAAGGICGLLRQDEEQQTSSSWRYQSNSAKTRSGGVDGPHTSSDARSQRQQHNRQNVSNCVKNVGLSMEPWTGRRVFHIYLVCIPTKADPNANATKVSGDPVLLAQCVPNEGQRNEVSAHSMGPSNLQSNDVEPQDSDLIL